MHDALMKHLFFKILLAQVLTVVLALGAVSLITRANLDRGLKEFVRQQESAVLETLVNAMAEVYQSREGWGFLRKNPKSWERILRNAHRMEPVPGRGGRGPNRLRLRERLFLVDESGQWLAGRTIDSLAVNQQTIQQESIIVGGKVVGRLGLTPIGRVLPPDADRFMKSQKKVLGLSLAGALIGAFALAWFLARHLTRPVARLDATVKQLSDGHFEARANISTQDEIGRLGRNVNQLAQSLQKNRTARERWMAEIAHELRTPVSILKGEVEALRDGIRTDTNSLHASLAEEVDQLSLLIDDLQTLALADAGALNLKREQVDVNQLLHTVAASFAQRLNEADANLELDLETGLSASLDARRIKQLVNNLLANAIRYGGEGVEIRIASRTSQGALEIRVEDSGSGVSEQQLEQLFTPFYRAENSRSRAFGGSGLGLSICRNIAEAHGGTIQARRSHMGGLEIIVRISA